MQYKAVKAAFAERVKIRKGVVSEVAQTFILVCGDFFFLLVVAF